VTLLAVPVYLRLDARAGANLSGEPVQRAESSVTLTSPGDAPGTPGARDS
jgi:hypothetical protein